jgi:hypothetical protein
MLRVVMPVFDRIDRLLDRLDRFDDRVIDRVPTSFLEQLDRFDDWLNRRLPASWVKAAQAPRPESNTRASDLWDVAHLMLRVLVPVCCLGVWLLLTGEWWKGILGTVVLLFVGTVVTVIVRETLRRR